MTYPAAPRGSSTETFHSAVSGAVTVPNPYAWLENTSSEAYESYVDAQNSHSAKFISDPSSTEYSKSLESLLKKLHSLPSLASPFYSCGEHFYYRVAGQGRLFPVWYRVRREHLRDGADLPLMSESEIFHDEASDLGAITSSGFSAGGKYWAYSSSIQGSEWCKTHVRSTATGEKLKDGLIDTKFTGKPVPLSWLEDKGFFYQYWPDRDSELSPQLRFHIIGEPQAEDIVVYQDEKEPTFTFYAATDKEWVIVFILDGGRNCMVKAGKVTLEDLEKNKELNLTFDTTIAASFEAEWELVGSTSSALYFHTTRDNGDVVALDKNTLTLKNVIPGEAERTLKMAKLLRNGSIAAIHSINVHDEISIYTLSGQLLTLIDTSILTILAIEPDAGSDEFFILESSFSAPPALQLTTSSNQTTLIPLFQPSDRLASNLKTQQLFYPSLDGTPIPLFLTQASAISSPPAVPVLLYIYGGFGISVIPHFRPDFLAFMLSFRGVLAVANVRGGGEKGAAWHEAATKLNRQVLFNDVIAGVQYIRSQLKTDNIILMGESMGGLNVSSVMVQQPDLVKAVICNVGALDVLHRKRLGLPRRGGDDIGDAAVPEEFDSMMKWAPVENVKRGVRYPNVLLSTGAQDDIVPAVHSVKMTATLQWASEGLDEDERNDVNLIVVKEGSGHGWSNSAAVKLQASVNRWSWLRRALGLEIYKQN